MATSHSTTGPDTTPPPGEDGSPGSTSAREEHEKLLRRYVQHHWVAAGAGVHLFQRVAGSIPGQDRREQLVELTRQVSEDRETLRDLRGRLGASSLPLAQAVVSVGVLLGRLKPNGSLTHRTRLTDLIELEALSAAVEAKKRGWLTLHQIAATDDRINEDQIRTLIARADDQIDQLTRLHQQAAQLLR